jgi:AAA domain, putative AbiEii toxin, Type IV TA system/AAA ATPase domain
MFRRLEIENFRRFEHYELHDLGRVNLLVGVNNSGKTSILEAIQMLASPSDSRPIRAALERRGELVYEPEWELSQAWFQLQAADVDICRLFRGHVMGPSSSFSVQGVGDRNYSLLATIRPMESLQGLAAGNLEHLAALESSFHELNLRWNGDSEAEIAMPIVVRGGVAKPRVRFPPSLAPQESSTPDVSFLGASSLSPDEIIRLFDAVSLTDEEALVIQSLQLIEPEIDRIAAATNGGARTRRGGIKVRCRGQKQPVPIGSMGDGIWRMLGLVLTLVRCSGGCLLVDEIDTGLHYTVLEDMWRLVCEVARRLDVQVFATTHSSDCWTSLAAVVRETDSRDVSIQRIEPDSQQAVAFSAEEMVLAAERGIEVR